MTNKELLLLLARQLRRKANKKGNVHINDIDLEIDMAARELEEYEKEKTPVKKFIFVEDGTVDADELTEMLSATNPEIKVIVYRQGGREPSLVEVDKKDG